MEYWMLSYSTDCGVGWVVVSRQGVSRVMLPGETSLPVVEISQSPVPEYGRQAVVQLQEYFAGRLKTFDLLLDTGRLTAFQEQVLRQAAAIPYGTVISYGRLAELAGYPGASRAAGSVMAANRLPVIIPCHRVVSASGSLTGYSGAGGVDTKKFLLIMEGVEFRGVKICRNFDSY